MNGAAATEQWTERRQERRTDVGNVVALVDLCDERGPVSCCIWDMSSRGACLLVPPDVPLPHSFKMEVDQTWRVASVVWRRWSHVGVQFLK